MSIVLPRSLGGLSSQEEDLRELVMETPCGVFQSAVELTTTSRSTTVTSWSVNLTYWFSID